MARTGRDIEDEYKKMHRVEVVSSGKAIEKDYYNSLSDGVTPGSVRYTEVLKDLKRKVEAFKLNPKYNKKDVARYEAAIEYALAKNAKYTQIFGKVVWASRELQSTPKKESEHHRDKRVLKWLKGDIKLTVNQHNSRIKQQKKILKKEVGIFDIGTCWERLETDADSIESKIIRYARTEESFSSLTIASKIADSFHIKIEKAKEQAMSY